MSFRWSPLSANREGRAGEGRGHRMENRQEGGGCAVFFSHVDYSAFVCSDGFRFPDVCKTYCLTYCMFSDVAITKQKGLWENIFSLMLFLQILDMC